MKFMLRVEDPNFKPEDVFKAINKYLTKKKKMGVFIEVHPMLDYNEDSMKKVLNGYGSKGDINAKS